MGDRAQGLMVGIDVGGTSMKGGLLDASGLLRGETETRPTKHADGGTSEEVIENLVELTTSLAAQGAGLSPAGIVGVGVAMAWKRQGLLAPAPAAPGG